MADDELTLRVTHLEREVARLHAELRETTSDARAARVLAGGADRDVSEIRAQLNAHLSALNALRETQREHSEEFVRIRQEMRDGFSTLAVGMAQITALLTIRDGDGDAPPAG